MSFVTTAESIGMDSWYFTCICDDANAQYFAKVRVLLERGETIGLLP